MVDGVLVVVTVVSLAFAAVMGLISWRVLSQERRSSDARAEALSAAAIDFDADLHEPVAAPRLPARPAISVRQAPIARPPAAGPDLFSHPDPVTSNGRRLVTAVGLGAALVTIAIGAVVALNPRPAESLPASPASAQVRTPLELVSLDHARAGNRLAIRGLVRNPATGDAVKDLVAVVFLFDSRGGYLGTTDAPVVDAVLAPGTDSPFEVPVPAGLQVGRYRLTFRVAAAPVPHVDRRRAAPTVPAPADTHRVAMERRASVVNVSAPTR